MDPTKAGSCDQLSACVLKFCAGSFVSLVTVLFKQCLKSGSLPEEWKFHKICSIFKSGMIIMLNNKHPSLCSTCSLKYWSPFQNHLFHTNFYQSVSIQILGNHCCLSTLTLLFKGAKELERRQPTYLIYFDFKKAFDSVSHSVLLYKQWFTDIMGSLWVWFIGYLTNCYHFVQLYRQLPLWSSSSSFWCSPGQCNEAITIS